MKRKLSLLVADVIIRFLYKMRFMKYRIFHIGSFSLRLPLNHTLPYFKSRHPLYDEFIGFIASTIDVDKCIIDVGSNVGDTAAFIANKSKCSLILVEPSSKYFSYLKGNVARWNLSQRVVLYNYALSDSEQSISKLYHHGGTASKNVNKGERVQFKKGDDLDIVDNIGLIKVDTDGYDSEVLFSFKSRIKRDKPMLFFENQMLNNEGSLSYTELYSFLEKNGYSIIVVFDNFGNLLMRLTHYDQLEEINKYLLRMLENNLEFTFFYLDVLVGTIEHEPQINLAVEKYLESKFTNTHKV